MNRETIAALHDVKQAMQQQQTLDLREARGRLDAMRIERDGIVERMARDAGDGTVATAITLTRYRAFQKKALARIDAMIAVALRDYAAAEETLTETFAEVRAIERLMDG